MKEVISVGEVIVLDEEGTKGIEEEEVRVKKEEWDVVEGKEC